MRGLETKPSQELLKGPGEGKPGGDVMAGSEHLKACHVEGGEDFLAVAAEGRTAATGQTLAGPG